MSDMERAFCLVAGVGAAIFLVYLSNKWEVSILKVLAFAFLFRVGSVMFNRALSGVWAP